MHVYIYIYIPGVLEIRHPDTHNPTPVTLTPETLLPDTQNPVSLTPGRLSGATRGGSWPWIRGNPSTLTMWVVRVGGHDGELRPWHYIYEGRRGHTA